MVYDCFVEYEYIVKRPLYSGLFLFRLCLRVLYICSTWNMSSLVVVWEENWDDYICRISWFNYFERCLWVDSSTWNTTLSSEFYQENIYVCGRNSGYARGLPDVFRPNSG